MGSKRIFIAFDIPNAIEDHVYKFQRKHKSVKWTKKEQLHITLNFMGDVEESALPNIEQALQAIKWQSIECSTSETGFFPNKRKPSVFWLGIEAPESLSILKQNIDNSLASLNYKQETRKFVPHLTLARIKGRPPRDTADKLFSEFAKLKQHHFTINEFYIYSSILDNRGAIHNKEAIIKAKW